MITCRCCQSVFKVVNFICLLFSFIFLFSSQVSAAISSEIKAPFVDHFSLVKKELGKLAPSEWYAYERDLFTDLLLNHRCDILIVPAQVQQFAIDKIGRDLITFALTDYLEKVSTDCFFDPVLVEKLLGENLRTFDREAVYELANKLKVKKLIWLFVGHKKRLKLDLTVVVQQAKDDEKYSANLPAKVNNWFGLAFSDAYPPYESVLPILPEIASFAGYNGKIKNKSNQVIYFTDVDVLPYIPDLLQDGIDHPIDRAYLYQFLAALYPDNMVRSKERMYAKSLVVLNEISKKHPDYRLLKSRAYHHLHRRPAALEMLKGRLQGAEESAMYALLMGNYQRLKKFSDEIKNPAMKILAKIELFDLHWHYELGDLDEQETENLAFAAGNWQKLLNDRFQQGNPWYVKSNLSLKQALDKLFPNTGGQKVEDLITEKIALVQSFDQGNDVELSVYNHVRQLLKTQGDQFCCEGSVTKPGKMDFLMLFSELADNNIFRSFEYFSTVQGSPEKAQRVLDRFHLTYDGHPEFYYQLAKVYSALSQRSQGHNKTRLKNAASEYAKNVFYSAQGQGRVANEIKAMFMDKKQHMKLGFYNNDFPKRHYWQTDSLNIDRMLSKNRSQAFVDKAHLDVLYSSNNVEALVALEKILFAVKSSIESIDVVVEKERDRFVGHSKRARYFAQRYLARNNPDAAKEVYRESMEAVPQSWNAYEGLAKSYLHEGDADKASKVYLSFPYFDDEFTKKVNRVSLANNAARAGMSLQFIGAYDEAAPLLKKAKNYASGSALNLQSNYLLFLYQKDYLKSAKTALRLGNRYNDLQAFDNYLSFLHLFSHHDLSWSLHKSMLHKSQYRAKWDSLAVGLKIKGQTANTAIKWLGERYPQHENQMRYNKFLIDLQTQDRIPDDNFIQNVEKISFGSEYFVHDDGKVYAQLPHRNRALLSGPDYYNRFNQVKLKPGQTLEAEHILFFRAYTHLLKNDFDLARRAFVKRAKFYTNEQAVQQYALPYFVWVHIKTGQTEEMFNYMKQYQSRTSPFYDFAMALLHGVNGNRHQALEHIDKAIHKTSTHTYSHLNVWYQYIELTRWLYDQTEIDAFRKRIVWLAQHVQNIMPFVSWAYTAEAGYTTDRRNKLRVLGTALYLDENSTLLRKFSVREKQNAQRYFERNNPFAFNESDIKDLTI